MSWQLRETSRGQHDLFLRGWAERSATFVEASVFFLEFETLWRSYRSYQFVAVVSLVLFSCVLLTASLANVCRILNLYTPIFPTPPRSVLFVFNNPPPLNRSCFAQSFYPGVQPNTKSQHVERLVRCQASVGTLSSSTPPW